MAIEVDFIPHGEAHRRLNVKGTTLRGWANQLEDFGVHFLLRNDRGNRVYEERDLEIFAVVRDLKEEYGSTTQLNDIKYMLIDDHKQGKINLRSREEAPIPEPTEKQMDLLSQKDIKDLMNSDRVKQFINIIMSQTYDNLREELMEEVRESVREEVRDEVRKELEESRKASKLDFEEYNKSTEKELKELQSKLEESTEQNRKSMERMQQEMKAQLEEANKPKGFFAKLFGG